jgi:hypothetical protein
MFESSTAPAGSPLKDGRLFQTGTNYLDFPLTLLLPIHYTASYALIESHTGHTVSAGPARRAERKRTGSGETRRPVRTGEFSEPHHSLYFHGHLAGRNRFAASFQRTVVYAAPGPPPVSGARSPAAVSRSQLRHFRFAGNFDSRYAGGSGTAFLFGAVPRPLPTKRAASGPSMTRAGTKPHMIDHRRKTADGQRQ